MRPTKREEPNWHDLPAGAKRQIRALLEDVSEKHPQGHYGAAARAALDRLPEMPSGRLPPRRTKKGRELSSMLAIPSTRSEAFERISAAVKEKGSILCGAEALGVHEWTVYSWCRQYPALKRILRSVNPRSGQQDGGRRS
jgi:hypothetical protein